MATSFYAIDNGIRGLLYFCRGAQIQHDALYIRFVRNIGRAQLQRDRITNLLSDMYRLSAVAGNPVGRVCIP